MELYSTKQTLPDIGGFFARFVSLLFIIFGIAVFCFGCRDLLRASQSRTWPTAQGIIQESSVEYQWDTSVNSGSRGFYHAKIMYDFTVDTKTLSGNKVAFGDYDLSYSSRARKIVNRYPKGKAVTVYYDPQNPQVCILEPGVKEQAFLVPGLGLIFVAGGGIILFFIRKRLRNSSAAEPGIQCDG